MRRYTKVIHIKLIKIFEIFKFPKHIIINFSSKMIDATQLAFTIALATFILLIYIFVKTIRKPEPESQTDPIIESTSFKIFILASS